MPIQLTSPGAQYALLKEGIDAALARVLARGRYILGEEVAAFEEEFARYLGVKHVVGVASGTDAIHLALRACGIGPGDEVITVPNTAVFTVLAVSLSGASPVLVDVEWETANMDPDKVAGCITARTRALLPVHLYGYPAEMGALMEVAARHDLLVIEDACQAHGAEYRGRKVGAIGRLGCFSFYPTKNLGALGDGGAVATDDDELAARLRMLRHGGQVDRYRHALKGVNSRLDEVQAAILRVKLRHLDSWNDLRRRRAAIYDARLRCLELGTPVELPHARHVYHLYTMRHPRRDALQSWLAQRGVSTLIHYPVPIHLQEAYRDLGQGEGAFPVAERHAAQVLSLPMGPELSEADVAMVAELVAEFAAGEGSESVALK